MIIIFAIRAPTVFEYLTSNVYESPLCPVFATIEENWDVIANSGKSVFFWEIIANFHKFITMCASLKLIKVCKNIALINP